MKAADKVIVGAIAVALGVALAMVNYAAWSTPITETAPLMPCILRAISAAMTVALPLVVFSGLRP